MKTKTTPKLGCSVLIAEDDHLFARVLQIAMVHANCSVDIAKNGREAIGLAEQNEYDVILTDHNMPHVTGLDLCSKLREMGSTAVIILMTARDMHTEALRAGADAFVPKPLSPQRLVFDLENMLSAKGHKFPSASDVIGRDPSKKSHNLAADLFDMADGDCLVDDRRSAPRRRISMPVVLQRPDDPRNIPGCTVDAGPDSLGIICVEPLDVGSEVRIKLASEDEWFTGSVAHCAEVADGYRIGFKF